MARGHALGDVGNNLGNAAHDIGRKDLVGMKHAQRTIRWFPTSGGGIIRIVDEQGSDAGACPDARLPARLHHFAAIRTPSFTILAKR